jgi:hypothetical protein
MTLSKTTLSAAMILMASFMTSTTSPVKANGDFLVLATSLCEYTKVDDRNKIRKSLKKAGVKLRRIYDDIKCNDQSLYEFAKANNATEVMSYYEKKVKQHI